MSEKTKIFLRCCICMAASIGIGINCLGIFFQPVSQSLSLAIGDVSVMATLLSLGTAFFAPVFSRLIERFPIGRVMAVGSLVTALSYIALSQAQNKWILYIAGTLIGVGSCCVGVLPVTILLREWYGEKNGKAIGTAMAFSGVAGAIMNPVLSACITSLGWRTTFLILAGIFAFIALPAGLGMQRRKVEIKTSTQELAKYHIPRLSFIMLVVAVITFQCSSGLNSHISSLGVESGYSLQFGALMVSCAMISNVLMKLLEGFLSDRYNALTACFIMIVTGALGMVLLLFSSSGIMLLLGSFCFGAFCANSTVGVSLISQYVARNAYLDIYSGMILIGNLSYALSVSAYGFIHDVYSSYTPILVVLIGMALISFVSCTYLRWKEG